MSPAASPRPRSKTPISATRPASATGLVTSAQDKTRWGWTGGVGAELLLAEGWSANAEVLYMQFRKETVTLAPSVVATPTNFENYNSAWVGRVGLNYRWGGVGKGAGGREILRRPALNDKNPGLAPGFFVAALAMNRITDF